MSSRPVFTLMDLSDGYSKEQRHSISSYFIFLASKIKKDLGYKEYYVASFSKRFQRVIEIRRQLKLYDLEDILSYLVDNSCDPIADCKDKLIEDLEKLRDGRMEYARSI